MSPNDDELRISEDDARFLRKLDALYRPPEPTAAAAARFTARLDEHLARRRTPRPWLLGGAAAAALAGAAILALLPSLEPAERTATADASPAVEATSTEETLLLLANGPLSDPDEALPEDYRTLASLLE